MPRLASPVLSLLCLVLLLVACGRVGYDTYDTPDASLPDVGAPGHDAGHADRSIDAHRKDSAADRSVREAAPPKEAGHDGAADGPVRDAGHDVAVVLDAGVDAHDAAVPTYTIGGTVIGLGAGDTVVLQDNGGDDLPVTAGTGGATGSFTFHTPLKAGAAYSVSVLSSPTTPSSATAMSCTVTALASGSVPSADVTSVQVTCVPLFTVGGTVSGLVAGDTVVLQDNGGDSLPVSANGAFTFNAPLLGTATYSVSVLTNPSSPVLTCAVSAATGPVSAANVTSVIVTCGVPAFTIGGTITGLAPGDTVVLQNDNADNLPVVANGPFTFKTSLPINGAYAVTVLTDPLTPTALSCSVTPGTGTGNANANVTSVRVVCVTAYSVGGTVTGLAAGDTLILQDNGGDNVQVGANGSFTFPTPLLPGATYAVSVLTNPTAPARLCVITPGTANGTVTTANYTGAQITCAPPTFTIGGTITGLVAGDAISLLDNGGDAINVTTSTFTFHTALTAGSTYAVTIVMNPTAPVPLFCSVFPPSGIVPSANVTTVLVTCSPCAGTAGLLVVNYSTDYGSNADHQGVFAVANGTPHAQTDEPASYHTAEQAKTWYTLNDYLQPTSGTGPIQTSLCVPPGNYTVQLWDIWGGGSCCEYNAGDPPNNNLYTWEIGNSSALVGVASGATIVVDVTNTGLNNVPAGVNFYGSWALWDYGPCNPGTCATGTCYLGLCIDLPYDVRDCGTGGHACAGLDCCAGSCVDPTSDSNNCSGCGNVCPGAQTCVSQACQ